MSVFYNVHPDDVTRNGSGNIPKQNKQNSPKLAKSPNSYKIDFLEICLKGRVHPQVKILSSFTFPKLYAVVFLRGTLNNFFEELLHSSCHTTKFHSDQGLLNNKKQHNSSLYNSCAIFQVFYPSALCF